MSSVLISAYPPDKSLVLTGCSERRRGAPRAGVIASLDRDASTIWSMPDVRGREVVARGRASSSIPNALRF